MRRLPALALLLAACAHAPDPAPPPAPAAAPPERTVAIRPRVEHFGLYLRGSKVGWASERVRATSVAGRPAVELESVTELRARVGGSEVRRRIRLASTYDARPGGRLVAIVAELEGDGGDRVVRGACEGERCTIRIGAGEAAATHVRARPAATVEDLDPVRAAASRRGTAASAYLDPIELEFVRTSSRWQRDERILRGGVAIDAAVVADERTGQVALLDRRADRIVELRSGALLMRGEPEQEARRLDGPAELMELARIALPAPLPAGAREVELRVRGLAPAMRVPDGRQSYADADDGTTRVLLRAVGPARSPRWPVDPGPHRALLAATGAVDHDHPAIRELAAALGPREGEDAWAAATRLVDWVHGRLEKRYGASSDAASLVLSRGEGDCTEHALLLAALARASGIPARRVHGLVAMEGGLYWHAWVELWVGEWIATDPTFGQHVADATHLRTGSEEEVESRQLDFEALEVLEARAR